MIKTYSRRAVVSGLALAGLGAALPAAAHTPFRQWVVYRKKHLLIGSCKADPESYPLGQRVAGVLAAGLPDSKARVARAPDQLRLASLITSGQFQVILLTEAEARDLAAGAEPFGDYGPFGLRALFDLDSHLLVAGEAFPDHHAFLVAQTLVEAWPERAGHLAVVREGLPLHPGVTALLSGAPVPEARTVP